MKKQILFLIIINNLIVASVSQYSYRILGMGKEVIDFTSDSYSDIYYNPAYLYNENYNNKGYSADFTVMFDKQLLKQWLVKNKINFSELQKSTCLIDWEFIFEKLEINKKISIDVGQPIFINNLDKIIKKYSLNDWKIIFKSNFILSYYPYLNSEIENMVFTFYSKELDGIKEMEPRWKRKQRLICSDLRDAIGKIYVKKNFPEKSKNKMLELVNNLK